MTSIILEIIEGPLWVDSGHSHFRSLNIFEGCNGT